MQVWVHLGSPETLPVALLDFSTDLRFLAIFRSRVSNYSCDMICLGVDTKTLDSIKLIEFY